VPKPSDNHRSTMLPGAGSGLVGCGSVIAIGPHK